MPEIGSRFFHIGSHAFNYYGLGVALSAIFLFWFMDWKGKKEGLPKDAMFTESAMIVILSVVGGRLLYVLVEFPYFLKNPQNILKVQSGGLVLYGAFLLTVPTLYFYTRIKGINFWQCFDLIAVCIAMAIFFVRLGCFYNGCCFGKPTDLPWAVTYGEGTFPFQFYHGIAPIHPTQIYESLNGLVLAGILFWLLKRKPFHGIVIAFFFAWYGVVRFLFEFLRGDPKRGYFGPLSTSQWLSLVAIAAASFLFIILSETQRVEKEPTPQKKSQFKLTRRHS